MKRFLFFLAFIFVFSFLEAQDEAVTAEERFFGMSLRVQIIDFQARQESRDLKIQAIKDIEEILITEELDSLNAAGFVYVLDFLASEGRDRILSLSEDGVKANDLPFVRREAARLLGLAGKTAPEAAQKALLDILEREEEDMVLVQAIESLGMIEDPDLVTESLLAMGDLVGRPQDELYADEIAYTYILAFQNLSGQVDSVPFEEWERLWYISEDIDTYNYLVRDTAIALYEELMETKGLD